MHDEKLKDQFGQYPVIYVNFSVSISISSCCFNGADKSRNGAKDLKASTMDELLQQFRRHVSKIARQLLKAGYLNNRGELVKPDQDFLEQALSNKLADEDLPAALYQLTEIVHQLTNREVVVLVDEYDTPTSHALQHDYFVLVCHGLQSNMVPILISCLL